MGQRKFYGGGKFTLARSPYGGLGLYAAVPFSRGEMVIEYTGERITNEEADRRGGKYLFEIDNRWTIDGKDRGNLARYINHSCRPNCEADVVDDRICIFALRDIEPGEELTYDYGEEYLNDPDTMPRGCHCDACDPEGFARTLRRLGRGENRVIV
ncbi:SET domain-containing protein [Candidatus Parcubacteria bacterium]|nr:MAG: SET domain-containing protein [Candidatus Parcubacteria bacterium]